VRRFGGFIAAASVASGVLLGRGGPGLGLVWQVPHQPRPNFFFFKLCRNCISKNMLPLPLFIPFHGSSFHSNSNSSFHSIPPFFLLFFSFHHGYNYKQFHSIHRPSPHQQASSSGYKLFLGHLYLSNFSFSFFFFMYKW
jgi:hypothetical protein